MAVRKNRKSWWVDFRFHGVRYRVRSPENSRSGAQSYETTLRGRLARGEHIGSRLPDRVAVGYWRDPIFADFAWVWFRIHAVANNRPSEQYSKKCDLRRHLIPFFGGMRLSEIRPLSVDAYKRMKLREGLAAKTVNNQLAVLGKSLRSAVEWQLLERMPVVRLLPVSESPFDFLTLDEVRRLAADRGEPLSAMVRLALLTGMRVGELVALHREDVDFENRIVSVRRGVSLGVLVAPKNGRFRRVRIPELLALELHTLKATNGDRVFAKADGRPVTHDAAQMALDRVCAGSGVRRVTWHVLRHTFATQLCRGGASLQVVQALLGHSTLEMTTRYAHVSEDLMDEAVARLAERYTETVTTCWKQEPAR